MSVGGEEAGGLWRRSFDCRTTGTGQRGPCSIERLSCRTQVDDSDLPQPLEPPAGIHEHDGLYVRLATGPSVLHASWKEKTDDLSLTGIGLALAMAFGVSVTPNLVIYGEVTGSFVKDPIQNRNGVSTTLTGHDLSLAGIGPGAAYYLLPAHLYFSGTLTLSYLSRGYYGVSSGSEGSGGNGAILTNTDIGGTFMVGKEWWVSANWGLGVAGGSYRVDEAAEH